MRSQQAYSWLLHAARFFAMMVQEEAQTRLQEAKRKRDGSSTPAKQEGEGAASMQETVAQSMRMQKRAKHPKR